MPAGDLSPSHAELVLLTILDDGPLYGYAISKRVDAAFEGDFALTPGVLYPLLTRLERQGLVTSTWDSVHSDRTESGTGRRRKWYSLTPEGRRRLSHRIEAHRGYLARLESFLGRAPAPKESRG